VREALTQAEAFLVSSTGLAGQWLKARGCSLGQGHRDVGWHRYVRALESVKGPERSEVCVFEQFRSEQRRPDAAVEPDVRPPTEVRGVLWL